MGIENPVHLLFLAAVALVVLGPKRLPELARAAGKSMREFRAAINGEEDERIEDAVAVDEPAPHAAAAVEAHHAAAVDDPHAAAADAPAPAAAVADDPTHRVGSADAPDRSPL